MTIDSRYGGPMPYDDEKFPCRECGTWFLLTAAEKRSFDERGLKWPKRCVPCRAAKRGLPQSK